MSKIGQLLREWTNELEENEKAFGLMWNILNKGQIVRDDMEAQTFFVLNIKIPLGHPPHNKSPFDAVKEWAEKKK